MDIDIKKKREERITAKGAKGGYRNKKEEKRRKKNGQGRQDCQGSGKNNTFNPVFQLDDIEIDQQAYRESG